MIFSTIFGLFTAILIAYVLLQAYFSMRFFQLEEHGEIAVTDYPSLTVVVPFRNEEAHLEACVKSILIAGKPIERLKIVLVDDHSEDHSPIIARKLADQDEKVEYMQSKYEGKKQALSQAIQSTDSEWIFAADADCFYSEESITLLFQNVLHSSSEIGTMPVLSKGKNNFGLLESYETLETHGIMAITAVALKDELFYSASGAALLYPKALFTKLQPYDDNLEQAAGDDLFLLYAYRRVRYDPIFFLKNSKARVTTYSHENWQSFFDQRLRWSAKDTRLKDFSLTLVMGLSMMAEVAVWGVILLLIINNSILFGVLFLLLIKAIADCLLLIQSSYYWKHSFRLWHMAVVSFMRPIVQITLLILYIIGKRNAWKGRSINVR